MPGKTDNVRLIEIHEVYRNYKPPFPAAKAIRRLLAGIPQKYLSGLPTIVIRDSASLGHDRKRGKTWSRKKKVKIAECMGLYHEKWNGEPAWIEIFIDNIFKNIVVGGGVFWKFKFVQDVFLAEVLFHEIGHHIHKTKAPDHSEREDNADKWLAKLSVHYAFRAYWYLMPILMPVYWIHHFCRRKKRSGGNEPKDDQGRQKEVKGGMSGWMPRAWKRTPEVVCCLAGLFLIVSGIRHTDFVGISMGIIALLVSVGISFSWNWLAAASLLIFIALDAVDTAYRLTAFQFSWFGMGCLLFITFCLIIPVYWLRTLWKYGKGRPW